jgi:hypothetical protein
MGGKFPVHIHPNFLPYSGISDPFPISRLLCIYATIGNILRNSNRRKETKRSIKSVMFIDGSRVTKNRRGLRETILRDYLIFHSS